MVILCEVEFSVQCLRWNDLSVVCKAGWWPIICGPMGRTGAGTAQLPRASSSSQKLTLSAVIFFTRIFLLQFSPTPNPARAARNLHGNILHPPLTFLSLDTGAHCNWKQPGQFMQLTQNIFLLQFNPMSSQKLPLHCRSVFFFTGALYVNLRQYIFTQHQAVVSQKVRDQRTK